MNLAMISQDSVIDDPFENEQSMGSLALNVAIYLPRLVIFVGPMSRDLKLCLSI
jgi:hypothetical protein